MHARSAHVLNVNRIRSSATQHSVRVHTGRGAQGLRARLVARPAHSSRMVHRLLATINDQQSVLATGPPFKIVKGRPVLSTCGAVGVASPSVVSMLVKVSGQQRSLPVPEHEGAG